MATYIRRAQEADLFNVEALIEDAKQVLKLHDNPQWQDGHPELATLKNDIQNGNNWLLIDDNHIVGTAVLQFQAEQSYDEITAGQWKGPDEPYAIIHRLTIDRRVSDRHLGKLFLANLISVGILQGIRNFRYDTHLKNVPMQKLGEKMGFVKRGIVYIKDQTDPKHLAYELRLSAQQPLIRE